MIGRCLEVRAEPGAAIGPQRRGQPVRTTDGTDQMPSPQGRRVRNHRPSLRQGRDNLSGTMRTTGSHNHVLPCARVSRAPIMMYPPGPHAWTTAQSMAKE